MRVVVVCTRSFGRGTVGLTPVCGAAAKAVDGEDADVDARP